MKFQNGTNKRKISSLNANEFFSKNCINKIITRINKK